MLLHLGYVDEEKKDWGNPHQLMIRMGMVQNIYDTPSNMTIVLCHNYTEKPYTERHMDYIGLNYVVLQPEDLSAKWRNTNKLTLIRDYIKSGKCSTEYILVLDSDDVVFLRHPNYLIESFKTYDCDMLFNAVSGITKTHYRFMPEKKEETMKFTNTEWFLNAGIWIAKTNSILDILESACNFVDDSIWDGKWSDYTKLRIGQIEPSFKDEWFPDYPKGIPSDQDILRWIYPDFYPRMQSDIDFTFAIRDSKKRYECFFNILLDT